MNGAAVAMGFAVADDSNATDRCKYKQEANSLTGCPEESRTIMRLSLLAAVWVSLAFLSDLPRANAFQNSRIRMGYVKLTPESGTNAPAGLAIVGLRNDGVLISEASVPATTTVQSGRIFVEIEGPVSTGIALVNPSNQSVTLSYYFTGGSGDFGAGSFPLKANLQLAAFFNQPPFGLTAPFTGTFTFSTSGPVAAIALRSFINERNEVLTTTVPVLPLSGATSRTTLLMPPLPDAVASTSQVVLVNPGDTLLSGNLEFFGYGLKNGRTQPTRVVADGVTSSSFPYTIPPHGIFRMMPRQARNGSVIGSIRITPSPISGAPVNMAILSYKVGEATVSTTSVAALSPGQAFRMFIEAAGIFGQTASIQTGVTLGNSSAGGLTVQLSVNNLDGTATGLSTSVSMPPGGQISRLMNELFPQLPPLKLPPSTINEAALLLMPLFIWTPPLS
jgi:hypothetical protein